jgi:pimeloyl-ACP methyl ester carboxylesterase
VASPLEPSIALEDEPAGFVVLVEPGDRIHFLDWGGDGEPPIVLVHGLSGTSLVWTPVARRLVARRRVVAMDLRGHGLSDAPTEPGAYDLDVLASDVVAVAEGSGALSNGSDGTTTDEDNGVVVVGLGFGAIVAAVAAAQLAKRCAALVLVDGGLTDVAVTSGVDVDEFLRGIAEPPEVLRSMAAYLADRRGWDPGSWDADQERAARSSVVETPAGRLVPVTRPHVLEACVEAMFGYNAADTLPEVTAPVVAIRRRTPGEATEEEPDVSVALRVVEVDAPGHNLLRYRPDEVTAAILGATRAVGGR